jgi:cell division protease FtsH
MPDPKTPQNDKSRKARSFGSYALFVLVLVAILLTYTNKRWNGPKELTHDEYEYKLYTGLVDSQKFVSTTEITGLERDGTEFTVLVPNLAERATHYQQIKAQAAPEHVGAQALLQALQGGWYTPQIARVISQTKDSATAPVAEAARSNTPPPAETVRSTDEHQDRLFVSVVAKPESEWRKDPNNTADAPFYLPPTSGTVWLEVEKVGDLGQVLSKLTAAGAQKELLAFDLRNNKGTNLKDNNALLTNFLFMWVPWLLIFVVFLMFMRQMRNQGAAGGVMSFGRSRAQLYTKENHTNVTFDDVAGADEAKEEVREVVEFLKNPGRFTRVGGRIPRGVLLVGAPGCGKTLLAKAIAGEAEVPFFSISGSDFVEMFVGVGASRVRDLFKQARENSPCIIFLDEIDAVGRRRGSGLGGGHDEREQTLNAILVEMDGFGTDEGIIVVAATNRPDVLDPALLRPGRFDREVVIDLPDIKGREEILKVHLKKVKVAADVDPSTLARSTPGYSGADLAAIINALQKKDAVSMEHLEESRDKVRYGRQKRSRKIEEEDRRITAFHEAGHAIVALVLPEVDDPHKVTIVPRGRALGSTMILPDKESYHMQKKRMLGTLAWAFGGRVSEAVFCGDISAGAADDIRRATEVARAMVTELGMSEKIGPINYAERMGSDFLGTELMSGKWHSEETARLIDEEVERLLKDAYGTAERIVAENRGTIERVAESLLAYETISGEDIARLLKGTSVADLRPTPPPARSGSAAEKSAASPSGATGVSAPRAKPGELPGAPGLSPA